MNSPRKTNRIAAATGSALATIALALGGLNAISPTDTLGAEIRHADFTGQFKSEKKELEAVGQWAWTSYDYAGHNMTPYNKTLDSAYSTSKKSKSTSAIPGAGEPKNIGDGNVCVYGGSGDGCTSADTRSSSSASVTPPSPNGDFGRTAQAYIYYSLLETKAECLPNGKVQGLPPSGSISYGNDTWVSGNGFKTVDVSTLANGRTYSDDYKIARSFSNTYIKMEITPSWGQNDVTKTAWSEVRIVATPYNGGERRPSSITLRSECGLFMNDNTGSKGPATTSYGAVLPDVDVEHGAEIPSDTPETEVTSALESASGFGDPQDIEHNGAAFEVEATRELADSDLAHVDDVLNQAAEAPLDEGMVEGLGWIRRHANGLPVVTLKLSDGNYARVTPRLEFPAIPSLDLSTPEETEEADSEELEQ